MKMIKVLSVVLLSVIIISIASNVFATNAIIVTDPNGSTNTTTNTITNSNTNTSTVINPVNNATKTNTVKTINSSYTNSNLPQTGTTDYIILGFVIVCVISAVYAYKKVKDYQM